MNTIRAKIILCWLLLPAFIVLLYLHYFLIAWCVYGLLLLARYSKPKLPEAPQRFGYFGCFGIIILAILVLIHGFYPFPAIIVTTGKILGALVIVSILIYGAYLDYKAFKTAP